MNSKMLLWLFIYFFISFTAVAQTEIEAEPWSSGFNQPTEMVPLDESNYLLIEKAGIVKMLGENGEVLNTVLDISHIVGNTENELGLISVAVHPDYPSQPYIYLNHTDTSLYTSIARYRLEAGTESIADSSRKELIHIEQPSAIHNGAYIGFGPDRYLYIGMGDGGDGGDPNKTAQDLSTLFGKILRIDVDSGEPYAIPDDNPFAEAPDTQPEIWSYGWRNPWRFTFDRKNGDMWIGDVGENDFEEINYEPGSSEGGLNYGWSCYEGNEKYDFVESCEGPFVSPLLSRSHDIGDRSVTAGYRYRGPESGFEDHYFFSDFVTGNIYMAVLNEKNKMTVDGLYRVAIADNIVSFTEDVDGSLFLVGIGGTIYKLKLDCENSKPTIEAQESIICPNDSTVLSTRETGKGQTHRWFRNGVLIDGITSNQITVSQSGDYTVQTTSPCNSIVSDVFRVKEYAENSTPLLFPSTNEELESTVRTDRGYEKYIWYYSEESIDRSEFQVVDTTTEEQLLSDAEGNYYVTVIDKNGCRTDSEVTSIIFTGTFNAEFQSFNLYPNPFSSAIHINSDGKYRNVKVSIYSLNGDLIRSQITQLPSRITLDRLESGAYFIQLRSGKKTEIRKIVKK